MAFKVRSGALRAVLFIDVGRYNQRNYAKLSDKISNFRMCIYNDTANDSFGRLRRNTFCPP